MVETRMLGLAASATGYRALNLLAGAKPSAKALLSHRFLFDEEPKAKTLDDLRRKLDWLSATYDPIDVDDLIEGYDERDIGRRSVIYTTDDIHRDIFEVREEFKRFGVPLTVFTPIGWIATEDFAETSLLVELVTLIHWYEGSNETIVYGNSESIHLSEETKLSNVDWVLEHREDLEPHFREMCEKITALEGSHRRRHPIREKCSWAELRQLADDGAYIGSHSVSHISIRAASGVRRQFELTESKRVLAERLGACTSFAYPYGTWGTHDETTRTDVERAGYGAGFLTNSDVITCDTQRFDMPRIFIPDCPISVSEFQYRVQGGGIVHQRIKRFAANRLASAR